MADGGGGGPNGGMMLASLAGGYPYGRGAGIPRNRQFQCGAQQCDPLARGVTARLEPWRRGTCAFLFTRDGGTGDLTRTATTVQLFNAGVGEDGTPAGLTGPVLTGAETDLLEDGATVPSNMSFTMEGVRMRFLAAYNVDDVTLINGARRYGVELPFYETRLVRALADNIFFNVKHGDGACDYTLSPPAEWGAVSSSANQHMSVDGTFWYTATEDCSGGVSSGNELEIEAVLAHDLQVDNDPASDTVTDIVVLMSFAAMGYPECWEPGVLKAAEKAAVVAEAQLQAYTKMLNAGVITQAQYDALIKM